MKVWRIITTCSSRRRAFAQHNPETHAVSALKSILFKGANFAAITSDVVFLVIFTFLVLALASFTVKAHALTTAPAFISKLLKLATAMGLHIYCVSTASTYCGKASQ